MLPPTSKAAAAIAVYETSSNLYTRAKDLWNSHFVYTVSVSEQDPLYGDVHNWLLSVMPDEKHHGLLVSSSRSSREHSNMVESADDGIGSDPVNVPELVVRFDDSTSRKVVIRNHTVSVRLNKPEQNGSNARLERDPNKITFSCNSYAGQQAVIKQLDHINAQRAVERKAALKMVTNWGDWRTRNDLPPRTLDSVILPHEQKDSIVRDVEQFLAAEARYNKLAIPWHRGYMFHGPPGTGKTSLVKALANHFNLDLWYISLSDLKTENSLLGLINGVGPRSILLLEDIDTIKIAQDRDSSEQGHISASSLLNALDGVATPHGLITMMTTNRFDVLDDALTRAGRMDVIEELGWPTVNTLAEMFEYFFGRPPIEWNGFSSGVLENVSIASIAEIFKSNMDDPAEAARIAYDYIKKTQKTHAYE